MVKGLFEIGRWETLFDNMDGFLSGVFMTLKVTVMGLLLAIGIGILFGILSTAKIKILLIVSRIYVELFQNTPLVVQVFFYYNGLPMILKSMFDLERPVRLSKLLLGVIGVGLYHGAYIAEVFRTGIEAIPRGQSEAAHAQGFTSFQTMRLVILPQSFKIILPPLANQALNLVKNTSVLAFVAGMDLMYFADNFVSDTSYLQGYILCAILYFIICFPLAMLAKKLEEKSKQVPLSKKVRKKTVEVV